MQWMMRMYGRDFCEVCEMLEERGIHTLDEVNHMGTSPVLNPENADLSRDHSGKE